MDHSVSSAFAYHTTLVVIAEEFGESNFTYRMLLEKMVIAIDLVPFN
jgi:hypothetical protein